MRYLDARAATVELGRSRQAGNRIWRRQCNRPVAMTVIAIAGVIITIPV